MRRRSRAGGSPSKSRGRRVVAPKRRAAPKAPGLRHSAAANQETKAARLARERDEALEQLSAASEILKVISSSPGDLSSVFDAILENATRICEAKFGVLFLFDGEGFRFAADVSTSPELANFLRQRGSFQPTPGGPLERVMQTKGPSHTNDFAEAPSSPVVRLGGARSTVDVPMLKEGRLIGAISVYRQEVRPFSDKQMELLTNFAAQAVIAIENTRLLNELRESLQQQIATADVLKVISRSPGELQPVFNALLENAVRICEAKFGTLFRFDSNVCHFAAEVGAPPEFAEYLKRPGPFQPAPGGLLDQVRTKQVNHSSDYAAEAVPSWAARLGGARSAVCVPMLKDDALVGAIFIYRQEVRPFTDKQIALVQNLATQAVIAIENTRLLNELRESLEQQTATSQVLSVISSSPGELEPVFQAMLANAVRICDAKFGVLHRFDGEAFHVAANVGTPPELAEFLRRRGPFQPEPGGLLDRVMRTKQVSPIADYAAEAVPGPSARLAGARSAVCVPMLKDDALVGTIFIYRQEVRLFTDKQIALVQNFAAQAVIAIENTRLLNELRESLEQQTATAEVLRVISSSPGELEPVFQAMLENATRICGAKFGVLFRFDSPNYRSVAHFNTPPELTEFHRLLGPFQPPPDSLLDRVMRTKRVSHMADYAAESPSSPPVKLGGARSAVDVPMLKDGELIGAIS